MLFIICPYYPFYFWESMIVSLSFQKVWSHVVGKTRNFIKREISPPTNVCFTAQARSFEWQKNHAQLFLSFLVTTFPSLSPPSHSTTRPSLAPWVEQWGRKEIQRTKIVCPNRLRCTLIVLPSTCGKFQRPILPVLGTFLISLAMP